MKELKIIALYGLQEYLLICFDKLVHVSFQKSESCFLRRKGYGVQLTKDSLIIDEFALGKNFFILLVLIYFHAKKVLTVSDHNYILTVKY